MARKPKNLPPGITLFRPRKETPDRPTYRVRVQFKARQYSAGVYDTLTEARAAQKYYSDLAMRGEFVPATQRWEQWRVEREAKAAANITVEKYSEEWLDALETGKHPRTRATITSYRSTLNAHIIPQIGKQRLNAVTQDKVDQLLTRVADKSGDGAARNVARTLRAMFKHAIENGRGGLTAMPFTVVVDKPKSRLTEDVPTPADVTRIAQNMPEELALAPLLAATCALRPGETLGLQRRDLEGLDTNKPMLLVRRQWDQKTSPPSYTAPKYDSVRAVAIPLFLVPHIKAHLEEFTGQEPKSPLFPSTRDKMKPIGHTTYRNRWNSALEAARTPKYVLHSLRHLGLTLLAIVGATNAEVMARGGHKDMEAAARYQHQLRGRDIELAAALGKQWQTEGKQNDDD